FFLRRGGDRELLLGELAEPLHAAPDLLQKLRFCGHDLLLGCFLPARPRARLRGALKLAHLALQLLDLEVGIVELGTRGYVQRFAGDCDHSMQLHANARHGAQVFSARLQTLLRLHDLVDSPVRDARPQLHQRKERIDALAERLQLADPAADVIDDPAPRRFEDREVGELGVASLCLRGKQLAQRIAHRPGRPHAERIREPGESPVERFVHRWRSRRRRRLRCSRNLQQAFPLLGVLLGPGLPVVNALRAAERRERRAGVLRQQPAHQLQRLQRRLSFGRRSGEPLALFFFDARIRRCGTLGRQQKAKRVLHHVPPGAIQALDAIAGRFHGSPRVSARDSQRSSAAHVAEDATCASPQRASLTDLSPLPTLLRVVPPAPIGARQTAERVKLLFEFSPGGYALSVAVGAATAVFLWGEVRHEFLLAWIASVLLVSGGRYLLYLAYRRRSSSVERAADWERYFIIGSTLMGFAWAVLPTFLFPQRSIELQLALTFIVAAMAMGGVGILAPSRLALSLFIAPMALAMVARLLLHGGAIFVGIAVVAIFYVALLVRMGSAFHKALAETIRAKFENEILIEKLRRSQDVLSDAVESLPEAI